MKLNLLSAALSIAILSIASGTAWSEQQNTPDCSTAKDDIAHLKHEKKSTDERKVKGVMGILPIGLVINAATSGSEHDPNKEMEINEYNKKIDERIKEITAKCNVQEESDSVLEQSTE